MSQNLTRPKPDPYRNLAGTLFMVRAVKVGWAEATADDLPPFLVRCNLRPGCGRLVRGVTYPKQGRCVVCEASCRGNGAHRRPSNAR